MRGSRQFSFDIKQAALKEVYGKKNYTYAYEDIKRYLQKNGFDNKEERIHWHIEIG